MTLAALAGVLLVVCWKMAEKEQFVQLLRRWPSAMALLAKFGLTLIEDLTVDIVAGCVAAFVVSSIAPPLSAAGL